MKTLKKITLEIPEYYLLSLVFIFAFSAGANSVFIALGLTAVILLQLIFKSRISGIIIASVFILINLFMLAAVTSEFNEFANINAEAQQLRAVGFLLFVLNCSIAGIMLFKYIGNDKQRTSCLNPFKDRKSFSV